MGGNTLAKLQKILRIKNVDVSGKAFLALSIISLLTMACFAKWNLVVEAQSNVINVGPSANFQKIQDAINNATAGDTILVASGTYEEDITINKPITLIGEDENLTVINNINNDWVIQVSQTNDVTVCNFTVKNIKPFIEDTGEIYISSNCHNITVCNDTIENGVDGIIAFASSGDHFWGNIIANNSGSGITFDYSNDNDFSGNIVSNNVLGLSFTSADGTVVSDNTISNNSQWGVGLYFSDNNIFYHNNFINQSQVYSPNSNNIWSNDSEGNYWSSYSGSDSHGDGIGDTPYAIVSSEVDNYPLMGVFSEFNVSSGTATYQVSVVCNETVNDLSFGFGQQTGNELINLEVTDENLTAGFCRLTVPNSLMKPPYTVLDSEGAISYSLLNASNQVNSLVYFTFPSANQTITVISSELLQLYIQLSNELTANQTELLGALGSLNATYLGLLGNYTGLLTLLNQLESSYLALNDSYQQHLSTYSENTQNVQNLIYIFAATTVLFLVTTVYLSMRGQASRKQKESYV